MVQCYFLTMRKIVVTFTIALSLGAASTIANAQPAAPASATSAAASTTAAANNNQTTAAKTSAPAAASSSAPAVVPPKGDKNPSDKDKQSNKDKSGQNKKSGNNGANVGSTLGIIAAIAAVLGLVGGGIFWAIQQNLIPNIQLPNIPGLPTNIPNPFAPPAPAPAPTSSAAPAPAE